MSHFLQNRTIRKLVCSTIASLAVVSLMIAMISQPVFAKHPKLEKWLPKETLLLVRISDIGDLKKRFMQTSMGRIGKDPQIAPLVKALYGTATEEYKKVEENVGVSLTDLLKIPQGEAAFAMLNVKKGDPAFLFLLDVGDGLTPAKKVVDSIIGELEKNGTTITKEKFQGTELIICKFKGDQQVVFFNKEQTVMVNSNINVAKDLLSQWNGLKQGKKEQKLADNSNYMTVIKECSRDQKDEPLISFFVDPIELAKALTKDSFEGRLALATLPTIGLDGVKGIGGCIYMATERFDSIMHFYIQLEKERSGILQAIAMEAGDNSPQKWVPADASSYMTMHWDVEKTFQEVETLINSFQGKGALQKFLDNRVKKNTKIDVKTEVIQQFEGRFSMATWYQRPAKTEGREFIFAIEVNDPKVIEGLLKKIIEISPDKERIVTKKFGKYSYYNIAPRQRPEEPNAQRPRGPGNNNRRQIQVGIQARSPCFAVIDNTLFIARNESILHQALKAKNGSVKSLADSLEYKLIESRIKRLVGSKKPCGILFSRPEEDMRWVYELASSRSKNQVWQRGIQGQEILKKVDTAIGKNPLPPFEVIAKYLAPGGGIVINDESGIHYIGFSLKRK